MTPAWTVGAWPPVLWQPDREPRPHFVHLGTHVSPRLSSDWPKMGQTVWGGRAADSAAGVSWDWIELADGVIAIADPMMMVTNLRMLGAEGEVLTAHESAPHLNGIVHRLPWQIEVQRALEQVERDERQRVNAAERMPLPAFAERASRSRSNSDFAPLN